MSELKLSKDVHEYIEQSYDLSEGDSNVHNCTDLLKCLATPPLYTTLRVNTLHPEATQAKDLLTQHLIKEYTNKGIPVPVVCDHPQIADVLPVPVVCDHPQIADVLIVSNTGPHNVTKLPSQVIVGLQCGMAVLRGANVYAQGVTSCPRYMKESDKVSIYADVEGKCLKGLVKPFEGNTVFVGNGVVRQSREALFAHEIKASGVAIEMTEPLYTAPSLHNMLPDLLFPQNLPSIVCGHVLNPESGQRVLDMCAAPGGKTTHIATLMKNKGTVIALDRSQGKIDKIQSNADQWGLNIIKAYTCDSRKAVRSEAENTINGPPPYKPESFDHVLLDAPCSALGQRPSVYNCMSIKEVKSYPPLQKKLFATAVELLRPGGTLVYSTCTVTQDENEHQVAWALDNYPQLTLCKQEPHIGGCGFEGNSLTPEQRRLVQRFDPSVLSSRDRNVNTDTIGFCIAKFRKS